ncbi:MAG: hypothetical protein G01um101433_714 [Parcubacteria group bacterium Gr01-1014_33]|nr:MAG: hypothetical protein G01um101433_714 [Parcubacteria group bacterium Gr01-1014_33]
MAEPIPQQPNMSPEEEIRHLERRLEEKKREFAETRQPAPQEKEILREVLKEHIEVAKPAFSPTEPHASYTPPPISQSAGTTAQKKKADDSAKEQREEAVRKLIELALSRTIFDAVIAAQKSTPYLLDELHDHLVDDYYDKLLALRKLKQL